jgi:hypothetical protein
MKKLFFAVALIGMAFMGKYSYGQEELVPMTYNSVLFNQQKSSGTTRTAVSLPFLDDFSYSYKSVVPDPALWENHGAFVNNTFPLDPVSIGVATLDGLNGNGMPYDSSHNFAAIDGADTLTSVPILMGGLSPILDSVYVSFFYQGGGRGDPPNTTNENFAFYNISKGDSLVLEFRTNDSAWHTIWAIDGEHADTFKRKVILISDPVYYHDAFQFRFRNYASRIGNFDCWHLDYIKIKSKDTTIADVAIQYYATSILRNYQQMPWNQFYDYQDIEKGDDHPLAVRNNRNFSDNTNSRFELYLLPATTYFAADSASAEIFPKSSIWYPLAHIDTVPASGEDSVVVRTKFRILPTSDDNPQNDSVYVDQLFYNYLAYDDGSSELTYRLLGSPAYLAQEYTLNEPDTLRAVSIHFANTEVSLEQNLFSLLVWKSLDPQDTLYRQDFLKPKYATEINGFTTYWLDRPVPVSGTFYIGWQQVSISSDLKMDVGFDINDTANLHLWFNVNGAWHVSSFPGAVMMRPLLSKDPSVGIDDPKVTEPIVRIFPNPVQDILHIQLLRSTGLSGGSL